VKKLTGSDKRLFAVYRKVAHTKDWYGYYHKHAIYLSIDIYIYTLAIGLFTARTAPPPNAQLKDTEENNGNLFNDLCHMNIGFLWVN